MFSKFWAPRSYFEPGKGRVYEEPAASSETKRKKNWGPLTLKQLDFEQCVQGTEAAFCFFLFSTAYEKSPELLGPTIRNWREGSGRTIEKMPLEILSEIFLSTWDITPVEEKINLVINLCHTSHCLRRAAFSTAKLWQGLDINLSIYDSFWISAKDIAFMKWWAAVLWSQRNNNFSLRFNFDFLDYKFAPENHKALFPREMEVIIGLIARARVLELNCIALTHLRGAIRVLTPTPLPLLEDLRIGRPKDYEGLWGNKDREIYRFLALFDPPSIRRLAVDHSVWETQKTDRDRMAGAYWAMWPKLTEVECKFTGEQDLWKTFFARFKSLERARITFFDDSSSDSGDSGDFFGLDPGDFDTVTFPCLLHLELILENSRFDEVFEDSIFPALKSLIIRGVEIDISELDRALLSTPLLERIELFDISFEGAEDTGSSLANLLPHLEVITIDSEFMPLFRCKNSFIEYLGIIERSGWLSGPWRKGSLTLELPCWVSGEDVHAEMWAWPAKSYDFGQVNVTLKISTPVEL